MKSDKIKILFFIHQLNSGGAQRNILHILKHIDKEKFEVVLVVINNIGEFSTFSCEDVKIIDLQRTKIRHSLLKIYQTIQHESPDIIYSGLSYLSMLFAVFMPLLKKNKKIKFVARETNTLSASNATLKFSSLRNFIARRYYKRFDLIICQSRYMKEDLTEHYNISDEQAKVINNPVDRTVIQCGISENDAAVYPSGRINLLGVGRLHVNKGFDRLITLVSQLDERFHVTILGSGQEEANLKRLSKALNVEHRVHLLGFQPNPYLYMKQADLFVLSSRLEGFPNVVLEANICGTPVLAFECPGVSGEVIAQGVNGYLIASDNLEQMKKHIMTSVEKTWDKVSIENFVYEKFRIEKIIKDYEHAFCDLFRNEEAHNE